MIFLFKRTTIKQLMSSYKYNLLKTYEKQNEFHQKCKNDPNFCEFCLKKGTSLSNIPEECITPKLCEIAVKKCAYNFQYVPKDLITPELCKIAVESRPTNLQYVPKNMITPELCEIAVESRLDNYYYPNLKHVPKDMITPELCKIAVDYNPDNYKYVPTHMKTWKLWFYYHFH